MSDYVLYGLVGLALICVGFLVRESLRWRGTEVAPILVTRPRRRPWRTGRIGLLQRAKFFLDDEPRGAIIGKFSPAPGDRTRDYLTHVLKEAPVSEQASIGRR